MIYNFTQLNEFLAGIDTTAVINNRGTFYYNLACSFDIETSSFYYDENENRNLTINEFLERQKVNPKYNADKRAIMYIWQFAIENDVIIGRTWGEFIQLNDALTNYLKLTDKRKLIIYVHNLAYEYQFIRKLFEWVDVFATEERRPLYAENENHIIYKCSFRLSGYSLDTVAKNLQHEKIKKLVGDLDYNLIRNSATPINDKELQYCINDVLIVVAFIRENMAQFGNISKIPLTQTGIVRRHVRARCFKNKKYRFMINKLTISNIEYDVLKSAFAGGFTHAGAMYSTQLCKNVTSYDFTSSYPTVLCSELFPMSKGRPVPAQDLNRETFEKLLNNYCCLFNIVIYGLKSKFIYENIISRSKCVICENPITNNGRVVSADKISMSITDVDFRCLQDFYSWDSFEVSNFYVYKRGYLPREIIESVLTMYSDKTTLKGVAGKETEYMHAKQMLNSIYGMCVTSIVRDGIAYNNNEWVTTPAVIDSEIDKYNNDKNRFLFYQWGVWCTSYARRNLFSGILECSNDYIYSDTDSIKIFNADKHLDYINRYNENITKKLQFMCKYYDIDPEKIAPRTIKGVSKPLGVWDFDGHYKYFKTLGAKRYLTVDDDNNFSLTVAGLNKKIALPYILKSANTDDIKEIYRTFNDGLYIPAGETGKNTHTYIDTEKSGKVADYMGNVAPYKSPSAVHLQNAEYKLTLTNSYIDYILGVQDAYKY